jgi:hypothetical protein
VRFPDLGPIGVPLRFLLHGPGIAGLWIDCPSVQDVRTALDHFVHVVGIAERDETEAARSARLSVLHDNTVDHLTEPVRMLSFLAIKYRYLVCRVLTTRIFFLNLYYE